MTVSKMFRVMEAKFPNRIKWISAIKSHQNKETKVKNNLPSYM